MIDPQTCFRFDCSTRAGKWVEPDGVVCGRHFWQQPTTTSAEADAWERAEGPAVLPALGNAQRRRWPWNVPAAQRANGSPRVPGESLARWAAKRTLALTVPLGVAQGWENQAPSGRAILRKRHAAQSLDAAQKLAAHTMLPKAVFRGEPLS